MWGDQDYDLPFQRVLGIREDHIWREDYDEVKMHNEQNECFNGCNLSKWISDCDLEMFPIDLLIPSKTFYG
jgi:hypothetical protein